MQKIIALLKLRFRQIYRMVDRVGWLLFFIFLFVVLGVGLQFLQTLLKLTALASILFSFVVLAFIDFSRGDKAFLASVFKSYSSLVRYIWIENLILVVPVIIYQCKIGNFIFGAGIALVTLFVSLLSPLFHKSESTHIKRSLPWLPMRTFELRFFAEKLGLITFGYFIFGLLSFWHIGVYAVWILSFCFTLPEVFKWNEGREMVHWLPNFVMNKVIINYLLIGKVVLLPTLLAIIFHPDMWYFTIYLIFCLFTSVLLSISFKYAMFTTVYDASIASNVVFIMLVLMLLPGGALITLIYAIIQYFKAEKNMNLLYA